MHSCLEKQFSYHYHTQSYHYHVRLSLLLLTIVNIGQLEKGETSDAVQGEIKHLTQSRRGLFQ